MRKNEKKLENLLKSDYYVIAANTATLIAFLWLVYEKATESNFLYFPTIVLTICIGLLLVGVIYSLKIREENKALREIAEIFNDINCLYRNALKENFSGDLTPTAEQLSISEFRTLTAVTQRIEQIFSRILGKRCTVTLKLLTEETGHIYAHTFTRSVVESERDENGGQRYEVGTGKNTAFDEAIRKKDGRVPAHYFSPDLTKESKYRNERQDYEAFYKSTIVVPIRGVNSAKVGTADEFDNVGFLSVDTLSVNRLNSNYHLYIMSSLSNQVYNFMSLMRGNYSIYLEKEDD